jgi:uncharacterized protein YggU (UPF0235/DUF167 family)
VRAGAGTTPAPNTPGPAIQPVAGGVRLHLKVAPGSSRDAVTGIAEVLPGQMAVKVAVTAVAEGGRANAAVIALLARTWRLPKGSLEIVAGGADRNKILFIRADGAADGGADGVADGAAAGAVGRTVQDLADRLRRWAADRAR